MARGGTRIPLIFDCLKSRNQTKNYHNFIINISSLFLRIHTKLYICISKLIKFKKIIVIMSSLYVKTFLMNSLYKKGERYCFWVIDLNYWLIDWLFKKFDSTQFIGNLLFSSIFSSLIFVHSIDLYLRKAFIQNIIEL
jgi:hypothetical protein